MIIVLIKNHLRSLNLFSQRNRKNDNFTVKQTKKTFCRNFAAIVLNTDKSKPKKKSLGLPKL